MISPKYFLFSKLLTLCLCCNLSPILFAQNADSLNPQQIDLIHTTLVDLPNNTELAIAIIEGKQSNFYGVQKINDSLQVKANQTATFEIGSITKVFTSHLLVNLLQAGKIDSLEQAIQEKLSISLKSGKSISFKQLANHTSGLARMPSNLLINVFNMNNPYKDYGKADLETYLTENLQLSQESPGNYAYSNLGMGVLGYTISEIQQKNFEELLQEQIFSPLNMTYSTTKRALTKEPLVQALNHEGTAVSNWDFDILAPAGAIFSTVEDLSKYAQWAFTYFPKEYSILTEVTHTINEEIATTLAWHTLKGYTKHPFLWHNGGTGGYKSCLAIQLQNNTSIVILSNVSGLSANGQKIDTLCFDLLKNLEH